MGRRCDDSEEQRRRRLGGAATPPSRRQQGPLPDATAGSAGAWRRRGLPLQTSKAPVPLPPPPVHTPCKAPLQCLGTQSLNIRETEYTDGVDSFVNGVGVKDLTEAKKDS
jgi:hypothetical protein